MAVYEHGNTEEALMRKQMANVVAQILPGKEDDFDSWAGKQNLYVPTSLHH